MKEKINKIISLIKGKKNFGISDEYVLNLLSKYLKQDYFKKLLAKDENLIFKNRKFRLLVKEIRNDLYRIYGVFQVRRKSKREDLLNELKKAQSLAQVREVSRKILRLHTSTRERLDEYKDIYSKIFEITGRPKRIIDLASGLNPCSIILADFKGEYFAYEISNSDINFLNPYFSLVRKHGLDGIAFVQDIRKDFNFEKADVCFLFKFLDLVKDKANFFIQLVSNLECKYLVVSFSKRTISLKKMNRTERIWFNNLLEKEKLNYKKLDSENETFYAIKLS